MPNTKKYCSTMELVRRIAVYFDAGNAEDARGKAWAKYDAVVARAAKDPAGTFAGGDAEISHAVSDGSRDVLPWTNPVSVAVPGTPVPKISDGPEPDGYCLTVERRSLLAEWFEAADDAAAEAEADRLESAYAADVSRFDSGSISCDFSLTDPEGRDLITWH